MEVLAAYTERIFPALEQALQEATARWQNHPVLGAMVEHHFGWRDPASRRGKRIRPLLLLLAHEAAGGMWQQALLAAVAVELIHNFSLIHDDIQDQSPTRRGRATVWRRWGEAQAINAGDALYALAFAQLARLQDRFPPERALEAMHILAQACMALVEGQVLDLDFEARETVTLEEYWTMVRGKTAALLAASAEIGALLAGVQGARREAFRTFGEQLGMAFQVWDDYLGIWGDPSQTGKPAADDILARKKTFPILYGLRDENSPFARRWRAGTVTPETAKEMAELLANMGARDYTLSVTRQLTQEALNHLRRAQPATPAHQALQELAQMLLERRA